MEKRICIVSVKHPQLDSGINAIVYYIWYVTIHFDPRKRNNYVLLRLQNENSKIHFEVSFDADLNSFKKVENINR